MRVYLEISTWMGISIGATHYYGELKTKWDAEGNRQEIELEHVLTHREAARMNKDARFFWKQGDTYRGFDTEEEIINLAKKTWRDYFPDGTELVLGRTYYDDEDLEVIDESESS